MAEQSSPAPDLASILRALQESSQRQKAENQAQAQLGAQQPCQPPQQRSTTPPCPPPEHLQQPPHVRASHIAPPLHQPKIVDPATIIEWAAGLRCVVRTITGREEIMQEIRKMIRVQHEHEEQWWRSREALIERQKCRLEGQKKLDEVLKSIGGSTGVGASNTSPEELARELETFDMKVYRAQTQMVTEMEGRLRNCGVPFFGTRSDLVRVAGKDIPEDSISTLGQSEKINEADLVELQRRMLIMLEDLCPN